jgi:hypothetical protein
VIRFLDGPGRGHADGLGLRRVPVYLRVVCNRTTGKWDALDQPGDRPADDEAIYAYCREGKVGSLHIDGRDKNGRRFGRWYATADYRLCDPQPDDATLRDAERWRAWATARHEQTTSARHTP